MDPGLSLRSLFVDVKIFLELGFYTLFWKINTFCLVSNLSLSGSELEMKNPSGKLNPSKYCSRLVSAEVLVPLCVKKVFEEHVTIKAS